MLMYTRRDVIEARKVPDGELWPIIWVTPPAAPRFGVRIVLDAVKVIQQDHITAKPVAITWYSCPDAALERIEKELKSRSMRPLALWAYQSFAINRPHRTAA
jgi:hypothetical protein